MKQINLGYIANRRTELGITLQEMAETLGFKNASTYMKYEKGTYCLKANHVPALSKKLNCKIEKLFFEENFAEIAKNKQPA
ncbi:helix-turn-helix domain-containing protein [Brevibacillus laterosporus]|uniref:helix-turn-helix domain-containing protein n=1 Tax=Brevibacillus laterosporus TaxID=1465 RepID=UPI0018CE224A|nr:helix-turn-helix transcriptional regulator [Brevibacillus laterosporus]MBG9786615.1 DNA-binding protein [Brevibacillus laterosporus]